MNHEISIGELAGFIGSIMDVEIKIINKKERIRPIESEVDRLVCNNSKLLEYTPWQPNYSLEQGISEVINWMRDQDNLSYYKTEIYNV